jgi:beta-glucosidase
MSLLLPGRRQAHLAAASLLAATMTAATLVPSAWAAPAATTLPVNLARDPRWGLSDDADPGAGNFDGGNASFSAQALAAATPSLTPGATFTHDGLTFTWPDAQPGSQDNVVAGGVAGSQTIALSGSGHTLGLIGAGDYGSPTGDAIVTYTDGTTESHTVSFADWWANAAAGGDILTTVPYINTSAGQQNQPVSLYYAPIPLQAGKTVQYLTLPDVSDGANSGTAAMHIFTVAIG